MNDETGRRTTHGISVIDPIPRAFEWARDVLFRPFRLEKWLILGFCAWLSQLFENGGGGGNFNWNVPSSRRQVRHEVQESWEWAQEHLMLVLGVAAVLILFCVTFALIITWLTSRGKFMFLDGVVQDRAAVVEPWTRFRAQANSLFLFRLILGFAGLAVVLFLLGGTGGLIWLRWEAPGFKPFVVLAVIGMILSLIVFAMLMTLLALLLNDFVVPLMYLRKCRVGEAWRELGELLAAQPAAFILYVLVKFVMAIAVVAISITACCLTCCLVALPYVGTVILLPLFVFLRAYPLYFLGQFGKGFERFATLGPQTEETDATPA